MTTGLEIVAPVHGLQTVEPAAPSGDLVEIDALGREFEQSVFGEEQQAEGGLAEGAEQGRAPAGDSIGQRVVETMQGLNNELESTMDEVLELISKKPDHAELLQLQLKAAQLFITHELSSKMVAKATDAVDQLVRSQ